MAEKLTMAGLEVEETEVSEVGAVLNIKVTPNRGDCLSVIGVARELCAAHRVSMTVPVAKRSIADLPEQAGLVEVQAPDLCPRYFALVLDNVRVGPSAPRIQARLEAAGMRSINNVVDITNYVMLESGQPLHAFDLSTLKGERIVVRRAISDEQLTTLDGVVRSLGPSNLVIADTESPVALAGIMGGAPTEISERTTRILLESAHFDPKSVRATSKSLDLRTEASYRFERTVDPEAVVSAALRAGALIEECGAGRVVARCADNWQPDSHFRTLEVRPERAGLLLGFEVSEQEVSETLGNLGLVLEGRNRFTIPSWRPDLVREIDLVEEVGRILGYDRIPERLPTSECVAGVEDAASILADQLRGLLVGAGLTEVVTHTLVAEHVLDAFGTDDSARVAVRSALSADLSGLRRSLWPGLLGTAERNARRGRGDLALFEVGTTYRMTGDVPVGRLELGLLMAGKTGPRGWQPDARGQDADFHTVRGLLELVLGRFASGSAKFEKSSDSRLHPGRQAKVELDGTSIALVGEIHPKLAAESHLKNRVLLAELALDPMKPSSGARLEYVAPPRFQSIIRDIAPRVATTCAYSTIQDAVGHVRPEILESYALTDIFTGPPLEPGMKSLTLQFTFRSTERTLTEADTNEALVVLRRALELACGATFAA